MKRNDKETKDIKSNENPESQKPFEKWKDSDKNRMGNDIHSEVKIANAGGEMEGGDNKQWHMDQGNFDQQEKEDFENQDGNKK